MKTAREYQKIIHEQCLRKTKIPDYLCILVGLFSDLLLANKMSSRRQALGNIMIAILGCAELNKTFISFEEAEDFRRGVKFYNEDQGLCLCLQNISSIYHDRSTSVPAGTEGEYRYPLQRLFNNVSAMCMMYGWRDPLYQVFLRRWKEIATIAKP